MVIPYLEGAFPHLAACGYAVTSRQTPDYNCIAWAAGYEDAWWWPEPAEVCAWPDGVPRTVTIDAFIQAFASLGYEPCGSAEPEDGFEKVALYLSSDGVPTHAARQLDDGGWTSKLGRCEDIRHANLDALHGEHYGTSRVFLRRRRDSAPSGVSGSP